jgi:succinate-semialdehyde dehydrogenase/glutarate-semialdehyde dehydrogenase
VEGFAAYSESLKIGNGLSEGTQMGPLANSRRVPAMERLVADALANGAKLITGGKKLPEQGAGNFYAPTVLDDVPLTAAIYNEEPFGPVASVHGFDSLDEMLAEANRLPWGLASYAFTQDLKSLHKITHGMQAGLLWINHVAGAWAEMPFGGVKDSGYGSEGGPEAIEAYLTTKSVNTLFV